MPHKFRCFLGFFRPTLLLISKFPPLLYFIYFLRSINFFGFLCFLSAATVEFREFRTSRLLLRGRQMPEEIAHQHVFRQ